MSAEQMAIAIAPIVTAGIAAHHGINVEKHWVGKHTIRYNAALLAASMIPVFFSQFIFLALAIYCGFGIAAMRKYGTKNEVVTFLLVLYRKRHMKTPVTIRLMVENNLTDIF